jgi:hypothetical protein
MHPKGQSPFFHWPQKNNICWVEMESVLKVTEPPTTGTGHQYILQRTEKVTKLFQEK